jgi:HD-like signal output (HDOD) protein
MPESDNIEKSWQYMRDAIDIINRTTTKIPDANETAASLVVAYALSIMNVGGLIVKDPTMVAQILSLVATCCYNIGAGALKENKTIGQDAESFLANLWKGKKE